MTRPGPKSARAWKDYYAREREELAERGLRALFDRAPRIALPVDGALVFPHTKARVTGHFVAAVARALLDARPDEVVVLGVLHGARERDAERVTRARAGDADALRALRGIHDATSPLVSEEFSLDALLALIEIAAALQGIAVPRLHLEYPFLVGDRVDDLPGLDELRALVRRGCAVVATTDPIHHGIGYGTPPNEALAIDRNETIGFACARIDAQLESLSMRDFPRFRREAEASRSDFRDVGPVLATILEGANGSMRELELVDYSDALSTRAPTWVAGPLFAFASPRSTRA